MTTVELLTLHEPARLDNKSAVSRALVASTTAWGGGAQLDEVLARIKAGSTAECVELAIGARPVADPAAVLDQYRDRFTFIAHHTVPVLPNAELRPYDEARTTAGPLLAGLGITRYTLHPPTRRQCQNEQAFFDWAWAWYETLGDVGIACRLETMYEPRAHKEQSRTGGYYLDTALATLRFVDAAKARGWETPLLLDLSHLYLGLCGGGWMEGDVESLLTAQAADHLHVSANDGIHDYHTPVPAHHQVASWFQAHGKQFEIIVDEARRQPRRPVYRLQP